MSLKNWSSRDEYWWGFLNLFILGDLFYDKHREVSLFPHIFIHQYKNLYVNAKAYIFATKHIFLISCTIVAQLNINIH